MDPASLLYSWARKAAAMEANIVLEIRQDGIAITGVIDVAGVRRSATTLVNMRDVAMTITRDAVIHRIEQMNASLKEAVRHAGRNADVR